MAYNKAHTTKKIQYINISLLVYIGKQATFNATE